MTGTGIVKQKATEKPSAEYKPWKLIFVRHSLEMYSGRWGTFSWQSNTSDFKWLRCAIENSRNSIKEGVDRASVAAIWVESMKRDKMDPGLEPVWANKLGAALELRFDKEIALMLAQRDAPQAAT